MLEAALSNRNSEVRDLAVRHLREFESEGDPYSRDILEAYARDVRGEADAAEDI